MQPYFFPYLGYFHLAKEVDVMVFADDYQYVKQSWINRNKILVNGKIQYLTLPLTRASDYLPINQRLVSSTFNAQKMLRLIDNSYRNADGFKGHSEYIQDLLMTNSSNLDQYLIRTLESIFQYLRINCRILRTSQLSNLENKSGEEKIFEICNQLGSSNYINAIGGKSLYSAEKFQEHGIDLKFVNSKFEPYEQLNDEFVPGLSIIDLLLNINSNEELINQLSNYHLIS